MLPTPTLSSIVAMVLKALLGALFTYVWFYLVVHDVPNSSSLVTFCQGAILVLAAHTWNDAANKKGAELALAGAVPTLVSPFRAEEPAATDPTVKS